MSSSLIVAGLALAAVGYAGRYAIRASRSSNFGKTFYDQHARPLPEYAASFLQIANTTRYTLIY